MPLYELTKAEAETAEAQCKVRQKLGRNMRGTNHKVFYPKIKDISISEVGKVFGKINFDLELKGTSLLKVTFKIYNDINRVDVLIMMNKDSVWDPESLFITLPFAFNNKKMNLLCDKTGCTIQVKKDQILGTNCDFYLVQQGVGLIEGNYGINIGMPDSSLIYTSPLEFENAKKLYNDKYTAPKDYELYSWVMNNIWETNFKASLGGFIEFNYSVNWCNHISKGEDLTQLNHEMNTGFVAYRI